MTDALDPRTTAVLVMDCQPAILDRFPGTDGLVGRLTEVVATARRHGAHVGHVRVAFTDADLAAVPVANKAFSRLAAGSTLREGDPASAVHPELAPQPGDLEVRKTRVGAFSTTDLHEQLRQRGVTTLVLGGVSTSGVVLSTLRDAADRDYRVLVLADGTLDPDPEVHEVLLGKVFPRQADVVTGDELAALLA